MKTKRHNFTKHFIESLPIPKKGIRDYYKDTKVFGLEIMVTNTGLKSFKVRKKKEGKDIRVTLGRYPEMSIEKARDLGLKISSQIAEGVNPNKEEEVVEPEIDFGKLFELYIRQYAQKHKRTYKEDIKQYKRYLSKLKKRKISTISKEDVTKIHNFIGSKHGIYAGNRALSLIQAMYNKGIEWGWEGKNPAQGIKKFKEKTRDRFLQADEFPRFWGAVMEEGNKEIRDYILISLLTGARQGNVLSMRWEEVHLERKQWRIPETKNGEALTVPLPPLGVDILTMRKEKVRSKWVFPSATSRSGHLEEPKKGWARILERAGIKDLRMHDLRRTLGSWQAATGATTAIIGKSLGHKNKNTTAIYERLNLDPVKQSVERATDAMIDTIGDKEKILSNLKY